MCRTTMIRTASVGTLLLLLLSVVNVSVIGRESKQKVLYTISIHSPISFKTTKNAVPSRAHAMPGGFGLFQSQLQPDAQRPQPTAAAQPGVQDEPHH